MSYFNDLFSLGAHAAGINSRIFIAIIIEMKDLFKVSLGETCGKVALALLLDSTQQVLAITS